MIGKTFDKFTPSEQAAFRSGANRESTGNAYARGKADGMAEAQAEIDRLTKELHDCKKESSERERDYWSLWETVRSLEQQIAELSQGEK